jgi:hypothetical protein
MLRRFAVAAALALCASPSAGHVLDVRTLTTTQVAALDRTFPGSFPVRSATLRAVLMDWATKTDLRNMVELSRAPDWPGYFGTPAIANPEAGRRAMNAMAQAAVDHALRALDGSLEVKDGDRVAPRVNAVPERRQP